MSDYGFERQLSTSFEAAVEGVKETLKAQGFGVLTTIDVREKFKEKLGVDFDKYVILGACDPKSAHRAIQAEQNIGLMLPCNVIVYERDGQVTVAAIRPTVAMQMIDNADLIGIAEDVERRLRTVIDSLAPAGVSS